MIAMVTSTTPFLPEQHLVEDRLNEVGDGAGRDAVDDHRGEGRREPAPVGPRVPQQPSELVHAPDLAIPPPE
jgi:hypothetical protein